MTSFSPLPKRAVNWMVSMVILLLQSILRSTIQKVEEQQLGPGDIKKENQEKISTLDHWKGKKKKKTAMV